MASPALASDDENEAGDDVAVDYRLLAKLGKKKDKDGHIVIPKRGEKDFEPLEKGANVQGRALQDGREAMFGALEGLRGGNFKTISHAWLHQPVAGTPATTLPVLLLARGTHFTTLSHTLRLPAAGPSQSPSTSKSETVKPLSVLLPEEALHLISRGSLALYASPSAPPAALDLTPAAPPVEQQLLSSELQARKLTVQEASALWAEEVGGGKWEVYVSLKRMGYVVQRAPRFLPKELRPPAARDVPAAAASGPRLGAAWGALRSWLGRLWSSFSSVFVRFANVFRGRFRSGCHPKSTLQNARSASEDDEWTTLLSQRSELPDKPWSYTRIFNRLRIIPNSSSSAPLQAPAAVAAAAEEEEVDSPYEIYFHIWKPATTYKKSNPPPPDFYVSVVDARATPMPDPADLLRILDQTPLLPEPPVRGHQGGPPKTAQPAASSAAPSTSGPWYSSLPFLSRSSPSPPTVDEKDVPPPWAGRNPMPYLKQGDRNVVMAVVKDGGISWMRFGRGVFGQTAIQ